MVKNLNFIFLFSFNKNLSQGNSAAKSRRQELLPGFLVLDSCMSFPLPPPSPHTLPVWWGGHYQSECAPFHSDIIFTQNGNIISHSVISVFILCDLKAISTMPDAFLLSCFEALLQEIESFIQGPYECWLESRGSVCLSFNTLSDSAHRF